MALFLFTHLRSMHVTKTSETHSQTEQPKSTAPSSRSSRKSILALSVFTVGLNATAAVYTLSPSDFALPDVGSLAELLPQQKASQSNTGSGCRRVEGYSVGPAAARCLAARE